MRWFVLALSALLFVILAVAAYAQEVKIITVTLVDDGSVCKCLAQDPGQYWYLPTYDDSWWAECKLPIQWSVSNSHRYARIHFTIPQEVNGSKVGAVVDCTLTVRHDDNAEVYVNGYSLASWSSAGTHSVQVPLDMLNGIGEDNVIAVHVYNRYGNGVLTVKLTCRLALVNQTNTTIVTTTVTETVGSGSTSSSVYVLLALGLIALAAALLLRPIVSKRLGL